MLSKPISRPSCVLTSLPGWSCRGSGNLRPGSTCADPSCRLRLALYGHPDSGGHWERHCESHLKKVGFEAIRDWRSVFWHRELATLLVVYVDDFKLAGPEGNLPKAWDLIRSGVRTENPGPLGKYLGCEHQFGEVLVGPGQAPLDVLLTAPPPQAGGCGARPSGGPFTRVRTLTCCMAGFLKQCVDKYLELSGKDTASLRKAATPFVEETAAGAPNAGGEGEAELAPKGQLAGIAARVLMKVLYAARMMSF